MVQQAPRVFEGIANRHAKLTCNSLYEISLLHNVYKVVREILIVLLSSQSYMGVRLGMPMNDHDWLALLLK